MSGGADFRVDALPDGAVFHLTRPEKLNAITRPTLLGLAACIDDLEARGLRVLAVSYTHLTLPTNREV